MYKKKRFDICLILLVLCFGLIAMNYFLLIKINDNSTPYTLQNRLENQPDINEPIHVKMSEDYTDTLKNLYVPPLQYQSCDFRQIGYLTNSIERLPFFGRKLNRHDRWAYYTLQNGIKLPITYNNRECTQTPGCEMISDKDEIKIEGQTYTVRLYDVKVFGY